MPCRIYSQWPGDRPEQDPAARGHVCAPASGSGTPDHAGRRDDQREDSSARRRRRHRSATPVHDHAWRREAEFHRCHQFDDWRFQRQREHAKRIPESGAIASMISSVIFDLDGTLTMIPSPWRYVHERLGVWENKACGYLEEWLSGRMSYEEFCQRDASLWNGRSVDEIHTYLDEIEWNRHVPTVVRQLVAAQIPSIIISSGFKYVAAKIQEQCGWDPLLIYANELVD